MTVMYEDRRGWRYKVMPDSSGKFCLKYHKPKSGSAMGWILSHHIQKFIRDKLEKEG